MSILRNTLAVLLGYAVFASGTMLPSLLSDIGPPAGATVTTILIFFYKLLFSILAGALAQIVSKTRTLTINYVLAGMIAGVALFSLFRSGGSQYSQLAAIFLFAPASILGGLYRRRQTMLSSAASAQDNEGRLPGMKRSTRILITILICGLIFSFFRMVSGHGGSGLYDLIDALVYSSIILFLSAVIVLLINIRHYKKHLDTVVFLLIGLPLTVVFIRGTIKSFHYNRTPDLSVKYKLPVSREQYLFDSTNIQTAIDSMTAMRNRQYGGPDVLYATIDTIIYSQAGDKIFVSYIKKFERNDLGNDLDPDYLAADGRDSSFWRLTDTRYGMSGSFHDVESLKREVRKFYFNQFSFLDKDSTAENYFWKVVL